MRAAKEANKRGLNLSFTGHSLGGGLGSYGSILTGKKAIIFNAAGLNYFNRINAFFTGIDHGKSAKELIDVIVVKPEALNNFQDLVPFFIPDSIGRRIDLDPRTTDSFLGQHGMGNVCESLSSPCIY